MTGMVEGIVDVFDAFLDSRLDNIHTVLPGRIESYEGHVTRKARVKPMVNLKSLKNADISIPPIDGVPVVFPSSNVFSLLFPLKKGDGCLLLFSETGIGNFLNNTEPVNTEDKSRFSLTDCICIPGLWSFPAVPTSNSTIEITDTGEIHLNGNTKTFVTYEALDLALQAFKTSIESSIAGAITGHTHPGVTSGPSSTGPGAGAAPPTSLDISQSQTQTIKTGG